MIIIPCCIGIMALGSYVVNRKRRGVMTPDRLKIYNAALSGSLKSPEKLEELAAAFEKENLTEQGKLLRQRARLRRLPEPVKLARRQAFRKATKSMNKAGVLKMADIYDNEGCTKAALRLRQIASGLPDPKVFVSEAPPEPTAAGEETPGEESSTQ